MDALSKSDPMVVVSEMSPATNNIWAEVGRTERISDNLNPAFATSIRAKYSFETIQKLKFSVYDVDTQNLRAPLTSHDFLGECETTLAQLIVDRSGSLTSDLLHCPKRTQTPGRLTVRAEEIKGGSDTVTVACRGSKLDKKDLFGKSDPYLQISHRGAGVVVHRTEVVQNTLNPVWRDFTVPVSQLCNGDLDRELSIEVFDFNKHEAHEIIGRFGPVTLRGLTSRAQTTFELENPNPKKKGKSSGQIQMSAVIKRNPTFVEYLQDGLEISLICAIDFTASNGRADQPNSLHFGNSPYARAIGSVGSVLAYYDRDQRFPVYGFGAKLPPQGTLSHCFPLNGNPANPEVCGMQGIMEAYSRTLTQVELYGPTMFTPVLRTACDIAAMNAGQGQKRFFVLLIITDGVIHDMQTTVDTIVAASASLPLSVVIVGVGNEDFSMMETLDADDKALVDSSGRRAARDIVQFIPFRKYENLPQYKLAEDTLAEIPGQVTSFFASRGVFPASSSAAALPPK